VPLGWSSDGTELLVEREDPTDVEGRFLYVLHADGTETQVVPGRVGGAAISPDGSLVVFADDASDGLYIVDAGGGEPVRIADGEEPTFSPDGTQIAYLGLPRSGCCVETGREHVWVANVDGTGAHEILADEPALARGVFQLTWSPAGDRIALENSLGGHVGIYTFSPDGSDFTEVIPDGANPYWSPDGSQIAYIELFPSDGGLRIADADGSNVRTIGFANSGPWHPGTPEPAAGA
jgi:Tol biopolymer transport system component